MVATGLAHPSVGPNVTLYDVIRYWNKFVIILRILFVLIFSKKALSLAIIVFGF